MDKIREFFSPKPPQAVIVKVEEEKPKRMSWDRALLTTEGAVGAGQGISMLVNPAKAQDSVLTSNASRNNTATRVAGSALLLTSGFVMTASLKKDVDKNKMASRAAAVASTVGAGVALAQLRGPADSRAAQSDKMKAIAAVSAVNAAVCYWRSRKGEKKSCCK
eukprot:jgi/Ulvmu1/6410/UM003_0039.1